METSEGAPMLFGAPVDSIRFPVPEQCVCSVELLERCLPARLARRIIRSLLGALEVLPDQEFQVEEAVAELVANSERYAPEPRELRVYLDDHALWVGIFDGGARTAGLLRRLLAKQEAPEPMRENGRGLYLVRIACDDECWVRISSAGSTVGKEVLMRFETPDEECADSAA